MSNNDKVDLCKTCVRNQQIVRQLLSDYLPDEKSPGYKEALHKAKEYQRSIEDRYPLVCDKCQEKVQTRLDQQAHWIRMKAFQEALARSTRERYEFDQRQLRRRKSREHRDGKQPLENGSATPTACPVLPKKGTVERETRRIVARPTLKDRKSAAAWLVTFFGGMLGINFVLTPYVYLSDIMAKTESMRSSGPYVLLPLSWARTWLKAAGIDLPAEVWLDPASPWLSIMALPALTAMLAWFNPYWLVIARNPTWSVSNKHAYQRLVLRLAIWRLAVVASKSVFRRVLPLVSVSQPGLESLLCYLVGGCYLIDLVMLAWALTRFKIRRPRIFGTASCGTIPEALDGNECMPDNQLSGGGTGALKYDASVEDASQSLFGLSIDQRRAIDDDSEYCVDDCSDSEEDLEDFGDVSRDTDVLQRLTRPPKSNRTHRSNDVASGTDSQPRAPSLASHIVRSHTSPVSRKYAAATTRGGYNNHGGNPDDFETQYSSLIKEFGSTTPLSPSGANKVRTRPCVWSVFGPDRINGQEDSNKMEIEFPASRPPTNNLTSPTASATRFPNGTYDQGRTVTDANTTWRLGRSGSLARTTFKPQSLVLPSRDPLSNATNELERMFSRRMTLAGDGGIMFAARRLVRDIITVSRLGSSVNLFFALVTTASCAVSVLIYPDWGVPRDVCLGSLVVYVMWLVLMLGHSPKSTLDVTAGGIGWLSGSAPVRGTTDRHLAARGEAAKRGTAESVALQVAWIVFVVAIVTAMLHYRFRADAPNSGSVPLPSSLPPG
ncbi:hypothetical protein EV182_002194 [Spiromyces aspiralis]|uniref:Uncharacterized protein n=1 Tax=Spiromyces aspiralis TaxID=68401 RepID=A0ACC1HS32_9FUNG|nr:hypothetical protein EV182_002194 [Spiromyces aspiralis]